MTAVKKLIRKEMAATTVTLVLMLLVTTAAASALPSEPEATAEKRPVEQQKKLGGNMSSKDLYHSMEMGEQERLESLGGNDDEDDDSEKDSGDSLLSMTGGGDDDNDIDQDNLTELLTCVSCSGVLPDQWDERNFNEQSYCLSDGGQPQTRDNDNADEEINLCSGAVRCWKAKVREKGGVVRISRGCMGGGHGGGHRHSSQTKAELHPCMGAISNNDSTTKNNDSSKQPRSMVWTSSHTYSSASAGEPQPPSYVIECCNGRDRCNDGPFPSLLGGSLSANDDKGSLLAAVAWWRWSSISVAALLIVVVIVAAFTLRKRKRRNKSSRRSKRRNRSTRHHDDGNSDDSDKKRPRHLSLSSMSSSLSSVVSSSSCCEGKKRGRRKQQHVTALTMVDLLKGVVVTNEMTTGDENTYGSSSNRPSYTTEYSPASMTEFTADDDVLPPPYQRRNDPKDHQEDEWTSGSGCGMPVLVQRTMAKQIQLGQLVGKGRYGEVWRATYWNGGHEHVAVKIFLSKDEPSWKRETEIYSTVLMRHDNILGFIGSDIMTSSNSYTQLLLITHYHEHGSLYDFLQTPAAVAAGATCNGYDIDRDRPPLTVAQMLNVLYSVVCGLNHLHNEIHATQGKPGIAHRDIKSKNVLVKCAKTGVCCVADFGMAVTSQDSTLPIQITIAAGANQNTRVGTKRYMAPEVLDDSISSSIALALVSASKTAGSSVATSSTSSTAESIAAADSSSPAYECFRAYRRCDMYSYALVVWEVLSRTLIAPDDDDVGHFTQRLNDNQQPCPDNRYNPYVYRAPYQDRGVGWDPGFDDMRRVVCSADPEQSRPGVAAEWCANPIINTVVLMMKQCWWGHPSTRLESMRVRKTLEKLINQYSTIET